MNDRIKELRKSLKLSQEEFGSRLGVTGAAISRLENGERNITDQMSLAICREYHVDYGWLTTGMGEMFRDDDDDLIDQINKLLVGQNDFAKRVFRAFAKMGEEEWEALERFIDRISEK